MKKVKNEKEEKEKKNLSFIKKNLQKYFWERKEKKTFQTFFSLSKEIFYF